MSVYQCYSRGMLYITKWRSCRCEKKLKIN